MRMDEHDPQRVRAIHIAFKALAAAIDENEGIDVQASLSGFCYAIAAVAVHSGATDTATLRKGFIETLTKNVIGNIKTFNHDRTLLTELFGEARGSAH